MKVKHTQYGIGEVVDSYKVYDDEYVIVKFEVETYMGQQILNRSGKSEYRRYIEENEDKACLATFVVGSTDPKGVQYLTTLDDLAFLGMKR